MKPNEFKKVCGCGATVDGQTVENYFSNVEMHGRFLHMRAHVVYKWHTRDYAVQQ